MNMENMKLRGQYIMNKKHFEENWKGFIEMNPELAKHEWLKEKFKMFYDFGYSKGIKI